MSFMRNSVHYESGSKNEIAVVLSCPGQAEEQAIPQGPAKGQTGKNLATLLDILSQQKEFSSLTRDEIVVTNSWDKIEYPDKTDRSEATISEILDPRNLDRLAAEVEGISKFILCFGDNAIATIQCLSYAGKVNANVKIVNFVHLGNQALNSSIKYAIDGTEIKCYSKASEKPKDEKRSLKKIESDNRILRLEVVAQNIVEQLLNR